MKLFKVNMTLLSLVILLLTMGLINLLSATSIPEASQFPKLFWTQIMWLGLGFVSFFFAHLISAEWLKRLSWFIYIANLAALGSVHFIGKQFYGAQRWLDLGFFRFQPSETMKFSLVILLSTVLVDRISERGLGVKSLILPTLITLVPFALTVKQPDLGTSLLFLAIFGSLILFIGLRFKLILSLGLIILVTLPVAWKYGLKSYQRQRVLTFLNPDTDPQGSGYNSIQSRIAIGSGQFLGKGFRKGTQSQLQFLPERQTDFVFSVLSEEHGFLGSLTTVILYSLLFWVFILATRQSKDPFGSLVIVGLGSILFWHYFVNIGMVIGLLPIVGVPLPLMSYGGSSLLTTMLTLGVISKISQRDRFF